MKQIKSVSLGLQMRYYRMRLDRFEQGKKNKSFMKKCLSAGYFALIFGVFFYLSTKVNLSFMSVILIAATLLCVITTTDVVFHLLKFFYLNEEAKSAMAQKLVLLEKDLMGAQVEKPDTNVKKMSVNGRKNKI